MEQQIEHNNDSIAILQRAQQSSEILGWLAEQITVLAEAMGETMTPARLKIYIRDLSDLDCSQLQIAFARARRELKFFPKIAEVRELAGKGQKQEADAEARAAWDTILDFTSKYIQSDPHGNYRIDQGVRRTPPPVLSQRILDTVRRTGGWKVYKCMDSDDMPFTQKRFFGEYEAWHAVQHIPLDGLIDTQDVLALDSPKQSSQPARVQQVKADQIVNVCAKNISGPMTEVQIRDRREILRQQAQLMRSGRTSTQQGECRSLAPRND